MILFVIYGAFTLTETDENGLYLIRWRCWYCTETLMPLGIVTSLSVSVSVSVNPLLNLQMCSRIWIMTVMLKFHVDYQSSSHDFFKESMKVASFAYLLTKKTKPEKNELKANDLHKSLSLLETENWTWCRIIIRNLKSNLTRNSNEEKHLGIFLWRLLYNWWLDSKSCLYLIYRFVV